MHRGVRTGVRVDCLLHVGDHQGHMPVARPARTKYFSEHRSPGRSSAKSSSPAPPGPGPPPTPTSPSSAVPCRTPGLCQASEYPSGLHFFRCFLAPRLHLKPGFPPRVLCPHLPLSLLDNVASFLPNFRSRRNPCCPVLPAASSLPSSAPLPPALSSSTPFPVIMLSDIT